MASLTEMMARAKAAQAPEAGEKKNESETPVEGTTPAVAQPLASGSKPATPAKPGGFRIKLPGAKPESVSADDGDSTPRASGGSGESIGGNPSDARQAERFNSASASTVGNLTGVAAGGTSSGGLSLVDVAGFGASDGPELNEADSESDSGYLDCIPATAPERPADESLDEQQRAFIKSLDAIYRLHDDPDMFVDVVRKIMREMQENPDLVVLLADEDSNAMIRGLRQSAGMAQVKKQAAKAKVKSPSARAKKSAEMDDVLAATLKDFASMMGN